MGKKKQQPKRAASFRWRPFLKKVSRELLKDVRIREDLPEDVVAGGWMGYDGASEKEIAALEERLGRRLPLSYRSFLAVTNGWRDCGPFIHSLWPTSSVAWFRERNQDWIDAYLHPEDRGAFAGGANDYDSRAVLKDEEYFAYDDKQDSCRFCTEHLQAALEISDIGDSAILLLNPEVVDQAGEWEAWLFANWLAGAHRYRSFLELMQGEYESFRRLHKEQPSKSKYGNAAQQAACRGETGKAIALLRKLTANGDLSSAVSLAELCAFRGLWDEVVSTLGPLLCHLAEICDFDGYQGHLLRLLARAGHETGQWKRISEFAGAAIAVEEKKDYGPHGEYVAARFIKWFTNLQQYCQRGGQPPHELVNIFGVVNPIEQLSENERRAHYERAVNEKNCIRLKGKPAEYNNHRFGLARVMKLEDELIRIFEELPAAISFNAALEVSRAYMKRGDSEAAWNVLQGRIEQSVGGLPEQVAPIILLIDDDLRPLMTRERREFVLSTPRGREASRAKRSGS